jgi:hypothetical protein
LPGSRKPKRNCSKRSTSPPTCCGRVFSLPKSTSTWASTRRPKNGWSAASSNGPNVPHFLSPPGEVRPKMGDPTASLELNRKALQIDATMTPAHYYQALSGSEAGGRGHRRARKLHSIPVRRSGNVYCAGSLVRAKGSD